jgi:hypothetical protein
LTNRIYKTTCIDTARAESRTNVPNSARRETCHSHSRGWIHDVLAPGVTCGVGQRAASGASIKSACARAGITVVDSPKCVGRLVAVLASQRRRQHNLSLK